MIFNSQNILRRGQAIYTWGIGSMIDTADGSSLMLAGLDAWNHIMRPGKMSEPSEVRFQDLRLQKKLGVNHFKLPPEYRQDVKGQRIHNTNIRLPFVRFPLSHYCPHCGSISINKDLYVYDPKDNIDGLLCPNGCNKYKPMVPSRFVCICEDGHIQDFPFTQWAHLDQNNEFVNCENPDIKMKEGLGPDLKDIIISCSGCGKGKSLYRMRDIIVHAFPCEGKRPWLGEMDISHCDKDLRPTLRNASSVHNPIIKKSIYLINDANDIDERTMEIVRDWYDFLNVMDSGNETNDRHFEEISRRYEIPIQDLRAGFDDLNNQIQNTDVEIDTTEEDFRFLEYNAIVTEQTSSELILEKCNFSNYPASFAKYFENITLVHRLRETTAFCGFTRINPPTGDETQEKIKQLWKRPYLINDENNWLPALWSRGEGIFIVLNDSFINQWKNDNNVKNRVKNILGRYENYFSTFENIDHTFMAIHTLSHILINQISYECGYGSASIKERIYFNPNGENKMAGLLLYTTGDSEGSMGGLVRLGKPEYFGDILMNAIDNAKWCSADPVCIESEGQGVDGSNLAACHNCSLVSETSCECGNRLLDRSLLINDKYGFFRGL